MAASAAARLLRLAALVSVLLVPPAVGQAVAEASSRPASVEHQLQPLRSSPGTDCTAEECRQTALWAAAKQGLVATIRELLSADAPAACDIDAVDTKSKFAALHLASGHGHLGAVDALLTLGANADLETVDRITSMHCAAGPGHSGVVQRLIAAGVALDVQEREHGFTPLMMAAFRGEVECCRLLLTAGSDMRLKLHQGKNALQLAQDTGHAATIELLLAHQATLPSPEAPSSVADEAAPARWLWPVLTTATALWAGGLVLWAGAVLTRMWRGVAAQRPVAPPRPKCVPAGGPAPAAAAAAAPHKQRHRRRARPAREEAPGKARQEAMPTGPPEAPAPEPKAPEGPAEEAAVQPMAAEPPLQPSSPQPEEEASLDVPQLSEEDDEASEECIICFDGRRTHLMSPCGHQCVCASCAESLMAHLLPQCPTCRTPIERTIRVFK